MANYYAMSRTNYVRFKNLERVRGILASDECRSLSLTEETRAGITQHAILCQDSFPCEFNLNEKNEGEDVLNELAACLDDGEVLIMVESGHEKLCYVSGHAIALNNKGESRSLDLGSAILELATELAPAGATITAPEY